jgi:hypothetical protein
VALHEAAADGLPVGRQDGLLPGRCFRCAEPGESARAGLPGVARPPASSVSTPAVSMMVGREKVFGPGRAVPLDRKVRIGMTV